MGCGGGGKPTRQMRRMKSSHTSSSGSLPDRLSFFFEGNTTKRWLQFLMKCLCCCTWTPWLSLAHEVQDPRRVIKHADWICMGASHGEEAYGFSKSTLFVIRHLKVLKKKDEEECLFFYIRLNPDQIFLRFWLFGYITLDDLIWINLYYFHYFKLIGSPKK